MVAIKFLSLSLSLSNTLSLYLCLSFKSHILSKKKFFFSCFSFSIFFSLYLSIFLSTFLSKIVIINSKFVILLFYIFLYRDHSFKKLLYLFLKGAYRIIQSFLVHYQIHLSNIVIAILDFSLLLPMELSLFQLFLLFLKGNSKE